MLELKSECADPVVPIGTRAQACPSHRVGGFAGKLLMVTSEKVAKA
jgi:hypothetical protein